MNFIDRINYVEENIFSLDKHHGFMFKRSGGVGKIDFSNDISTETDFMSKKAGIDLDSFFPMNFSIETS